MTPLEREMTRALLRTLYRQHRRPSAVWVGSDGWAELIKMCPGA